MKEHVCKNKANLLTFEEDVSKNCLKTNIYSKNFSQSLGSTTDSFLKSRYLLSPIYNNIEAKSKYDMISRIENKISQVRTQVELLA